MQNRIEILQSQLKRNARKNLLYKDLTAIMEVDQQFVEGILCPKESIPPNEIESLIVETVRRFTQSIYQVNQFIQVSRTAQAELEAIYRNSWGALQKKDSKEAVEEALYHTHYPALSRWLQRIYPKSFVSKLKEAVYLNTVPCAEYSAEFQLKLLHIEEKDIQEPILDIGCGFRGALVEYLHRKGKEILGIDRTVEKEKSYLREADWLTFRYEKGKWGTIISNIALTNHMQYVFQHEKTRIREYGETYLEILSSLLPEGSFFYAPHVPFAEELIDGSQFKIERQPINAQFSSCRVRKLPSSSTLPF